MFPHPVTRESNATIYHTTCIRCKTKQDITIPTDDALALPTHLIQDAIPSLSVDDRELLISGICGPCFDSLFKE